ncbi:MULTISPECIES: class I SAM-dependent methyltransferase [unclassified Microbacterium]|uniref:class I SAM-dependent methyltransferase n=1 Tax=unclassified Microbacterium TaxID=2609290 RepID=UPI003746F815
MDIAELTALLTPEGLRLLDETSAQPLSADDVTRVVSRLRAAGNPPELVSAVVGQARLRARAIAKFGDFAERMLFTPAGLEQSTRLSIAARHAGRFRAAGMNTVADLGCGIGGDAMGLAGIGLRVEAVEADEVTAAVAAYNLAPFGDSVSVRHGTAETQDLTGVDAVWLDPARRTAGHAETTRVSAADYSPPLDWAFDTLRRLPGGMKLGPGFDRDHVPDDVEAQWVSADGSTIELVLWSGALAREGVRRAALVVRGDAAWELTSPADSEDAPVRELGAFVHEPEGAVIRARLIGDVARALDAGMLAPGIAYLTSDAAITSPFVSSFRVREEVPFDPRALSRVLRARGIGRLEIKKRGVDVDPASMRGKLKLQGKESATLLLTRVGSKRLALLADRVE